jgi:hypothetical protein
MPDEFSTWRRLHERSRTTEPFQTKSRHIHRFGRKRRVNVAKEEEARDRVIFLWVMAVLVGVGIVAAVAAFLIKKETGN